MKKLSGLGLLLGGIFWLAMSLILVNSFSCLDNKYNCQEEDLFMAAFIGVSFAAPAFAVSLLFSYKKGER